MIKGGPADPPWYKVWVPKGLAKEGLRQIFQLIPVRCILYCYHGNKITKYLAESGYMEK